MLTEKIFGRLVRKLYSNRAEKLIVDLGTVRSSTSLGKTGRSLALLNKGDGVWTLIFKFGDDSTLELANTELNQGDGFNVEFKDLLFTNTSQPAAEDPVFYIDWAA